MDRLHAADAALDDLGLVRLGLGEDAGPRLAGLRATTALRLPDCCVLFAALQERAEAVLSFDARLAAGAGRLGLRSRPSAG